MVRAFDAPLIALGEIDAPFVEEPDHDGLRIVRTEPHRQTRPVAPHTHVMLGHGHGGQLQVVDVHADRVAPHHQGPLQHPGHPAGVTRRGNGVPFSKPEAHALARRTASSGLMSTLAMPCTPSGPNRVRVPPHSHTMEALTWGGRLRPPCRGRPSRRCAPRRAHRSGTPSPSDGTGLDPVLPDPAGRTNAPARAPSTRTAGPKVGVLPDDRTLGLDPGLAYLVLAPIGGVGPEHRRLRPTVQFSPMEGRRVDAGPRGRWRSPCR